MLKHGKMDTRSGNMKIHITIHPIDNELMKQTNIYTSSMVKSQSVGKVISTLAEHGYIGCHSSVALFDTEPRVCMHFKKDIYTNK